MWGKEKKPVEVPAIEQVRAERERLRYRRRYRQTLRSTVNVLIVVAALAVLVATVLTPVLQIYGSSMTPTLSEGDIVVSLKGAEFRPGDLIAFYLGNKILVKRCIAGPGQWVDIDPDGTVYVRYSLVYVGADAPEEVTVHSAFPDLANSDLAELLAAALADGDAKQALPSVSGDTAGDGNDKVVALWLTEDGIPFLTADNKVVLCLRACDPALYGNADMQALDLGDGRDAIVIVWGQLWDMALQCAVQDAGGWRELALPTPTAAATLSAPILAMKI